MGTIPHPPLPSAFVNCHSRPIVILATAGIHPFAILLFARKRKRRFIAENGKPLRRQSRRKFPPPKAALIYAAFCGATHSRIFPSCFARWFALRANSKNAAIIANAIMTAPKARLDSRRSLPPRRRGREWRRFKKPTKNSPCPFRD